MTTIFGVSVVGDLLTVSVHLMLVTVALLVACILWMSRWS